MLPRHRILWDTKPKASDIEDDLDSPTEGLNVDLSKYPHFVPQPKWLKWQDNPPLAEYSLGGNNHERPLTDEELVQAIREQRERNKANLSEHDTIRPLPRIDIQTTEHRAFQDNFFQRGLYNNFLVMYFGGFLGTKVMVWTLPRVEWIRLLYIAPIIRRVVQVARYTVGLPVHHPYVSFWHWSNARLGMKYKKRIKLATQFWRMRSYHNLHGRLPVMFASFYAGGLLSGGDMKWGYVAAYLTTFFCPGLFGTKSVYNIGVSFFKRHRVKGTAVFLIGLVLPWLSFKDARNKVEDPIVDTYRSVLASPTVQAIGYALDDATGGHVSALFEGTLVQAKPKTYIQRWETALDELNTAESSRRAALNASMEKREKLTQMAIRQERLLRAVAADYNATEAIRYKRRARVLTVAGLDDRALIKATTTTTTPPTFMERMSNFGDQTVRVGRSIAFAIRTTLTSNNNSAPNAAHAQ